MGWREKKAKRKEEEKELGGGTMLGKKRRARALAQHRANTSLDAYRDTAKERISYDDINVDPLSMDIANRAAEDPRFKENQLRALGGMQEYVDQRGITEAEEAQLGQMRAQQDARLRGQRESTMQNMAMRGMAGSGQELASNQMAQQAAAQRQAMAQTQIAADAANRRMGALGQLGQMSSAVRGQEYGMAQADRAAKMNLSQFNNQQRMQQQMANQQASIGTQSQNIANRMGAYGNIAQQRQAQVEAMENRRQQNRDRAAGIAGKSIEAVGNAAGSIGGAMSDIRVKENIVDGNSKINELLDNVSPYEYNYKWDDKEEKRVSLMAQDLIKSELGREFVFNTDKGLAVDYGKALGTMMAINSNLHQRLKKLEGK
jgi:hypothetical protein